MNDTTVGATEPEIADCPDDLYHAMLNVHHYWRGVWRDAWFENNEAQMALADSVCKALEPLLDKFEQENG